MNLFQKFKIFSNSFAHKANFFYQNKLLKKRYLALIFILGYIPFSIQASYEHPKQVTLFISKGAEKISDYQIPKFARNFIYGTYSKLYKVNTEEIQKNFQQYKCFSQFFTRKIKPRNVIKQQSTVVSPSDSKILSFGQVTQDSVFAVKGYSYSLGHLLCGQDISFTKQQIDKMKKKKENHLYHVILYLSPGDYHRFHSSSKIQIVRRKVIEGALYPVDQKSLAKRQKTYQKNSRLVLHGKWKQGYFGMILVGALNVGRISVKQKLFYEVGEQMGYFNLGSTIVLLIESPKIEWEIKEQQKIKYGEILGRSIVTENK